ncbi:hypothetical protein CLOSCI_02484 [[Clostridium] scindens ATCC 35704]|nr:hypothetical protein CLOSCI_02484 [[Clostridium] scindens ATCC 35704]
MIFRLSILFPPLVLHSQNLHSFIFYHKEVGNGIRNLGELRELANRPRGGGVDFSEALAPPSPKFS